MMSGFVNPAPWVPKAAKDDLTTGEPRSADKKAKRIRLIVISVFALVVAVCFGARTAYVRHLDAVNAQHAAAAAASSKEAKARADRFSDANTFCTFTSKGSGETVQMGDGGASMTYSNTPSATTDRLGCILGQLKAPQSVVSKMNVTSGLDGMQTDSWDGIKITWSYNGNTGFNAVFEMKG